MEIIKFVNRMTITKMSILISMISCIAMSGSLYATEINMFERVNSKSARVGHLFAQTNKSGFTLKGYLTKSFNRHGRIPGHLHVDIYDDNGDVVYSNMTKYHRHKAKARQSHFVENIAIDQTHASTIRVIHHDLSNGHGCS